MLTWRRRVLQCRHTRCCRCRPCRPACRRATSPRGPSRRATRCEPARCLPRSRPTRPSWPGRPATTVRVTASRCVRRLMPCGPLAADVELDAASPQRILIMSAAWRHMHRLHCQDPRAQGHREHPHRHRTSSRCALSCRAPLTAAYLRDLPCSRSPCWSRTRTASPASPTTRPLVRRLPRPLRRPRLLRLRHPRLPRRPSPPPLLRPRPPRPRRSLLRARLS